MAEAKISIQRDDTVDPNGDWWIENEDGSAIFGLNLPQGKADFVRADAAAKGITVDEWVSRAVDEAYGDGSRWRNARTK